MARDLTLPEDSTSIGGGRDLNLPAEPEPSFLQRVGGRAKTIALGAVGLDSPPTEKAADFSQRKGESGVDFARREQQRMKAAEEREPFLSSLPKVGRMALSVTAPVATAGQIAGGALAPEVGIPQSVGELVGGIAGAGASPTVGRLAGKVAGPLVGGVVPPAARATGNSIADVRASLREPLREKTIAKIPERVPIPKANYESLEKELVPLCGTRSGVRPAWNQTEHEKTFELLS